MYVSDSLCYLGRAWSVRSGGGDEGDSFLSFCILTLELPSPASRLSRTITSGLP